MLTQEYEGLMVLQGKWGPQALWEPALISALNLFPSPQEPEQEEYFGELITM